GESFLAREGKDLGLDLGPALLAGDKEDATGPPMLERRDDRLGAAADGADEQGLRHGNLHKNYCGSGDRQPSSSSGRWTAAAARVGLPSADTTADRTGRGTSRGNRGWLPGLAGSVRERRWRARPTGLRRGGTSGCGRARRGGRPLAACRAAGAGSRGTQAAAN